MTTRNILAVLAFSTASTSYAADEIHWTVTGQTSVTFDWRGTGAENLIRYGTSPGDYTSTVTAVTPSPLPFSSSGPFWEARLTGLKEDTLYYYAIPNGPERTFRTPLSRGSSNFIVYALADIGDTASYPNVSPVQNLIANGRPKFVLVAGDLSYGDSHGESAVDQHFNDVMVWSQEAAYMPAWGNHEWDNNGDDLRNYKGRFDLPNPQTSPGSPSIGCCGEDWYWFDYGNVRFIAYPEPWSGAWSDWNSKAITLMDDAQTDPDTDFIVTFGHRPAYSSGHHSGNPKLKGILDAFGDTHSRYVLNVNGHSHNYERSFPQHGVVHVTVGTGGSSLEQDGSCLWLTCTPPAWSAFRAMRQGPLKLRFTDTGIEGWFICGPPGEGTNDASRTVGSVVDSLKLGTVSNPLASEASLTGTTREAATPTFGPIADPTIKAGTISLITDLAKVFTVPNVPRPSYLLRSTDPSFGTRIIRITGDKGSSIPGGGTWGYDVRQHYAKDPVWNADQTIMVLENRGGSPNPLWLDGETYQRLNICGAADDGMYGRWHPTKPEIRIRPEGNKVRWFDVINCSEVKSISLPFSFGSGPDGGPFSEGNPSNDGRYAALAKDEDEIFVVDMDPPSRSPRIGPVYNEESCGLSDCRMDWVAISPSGKYALVQYEGDHTRVFDVSPTTLALIPRPMPPDSPQCGAGQTAAAGYIFNVGHADMAMNPFDQHEDVVVGQRRSWCPSTVNGISMGSVVMIRLKDNKVTTLIGPSNEAYSYHVSTRNLARPGWAYVGYWPTSSGKRFNDEIIALKMDGSKSVERLAHQHSDSSGCYRCEPHPVPSPDGRRVIWASSWTLNCGSSCGSSSDIGAYIADTRL